jgi:hypothetical protein
MGTGFDGIMRGNISVDTDLRIDGVSTGFILLFDRGRRLLPWNKCEDICLDMGVRSALCGGKL